MSFTKYDFMTRKELAYELSKRFKIINGKNSKLPIRTNAVPYKLRLFLIKDDLQHNRDPYVKFENPQPTFIGIVDKDVSE